MNTATKFNPETYKFPAPTVALRRNPILEADSYKLSHPDFYPAEVRGMHANIVARTNGDTIVFAGLTQYLKSRFLSTQVTMQDVDEAEAFATAHGEPFNRRAWEKVVNVYGGFIPLTIRAVPEGTKVRSGNVVMSIECTDRDLCWMPSNRETSLLRGVWYPSTIATNDLKNYRMLKRFASDTMDDGSTWLPFALHDFGGRGVTCGEQAEIGGAAHLIYFMGSDTMEGVRAANYYYGCDMSAFSVMATEHTIQCSFGPTRQLDYLNSVIDTAATKSRAAGRPMIVSIVIDGYDTIREALDLCTGELRDKIATYGKELGMKVVLRPDSGDPLTLIPQLLKVMENGFGAVRNGKGYKKIGAIEGHPYGGCIGLLWGDGIDSAAMADILTVVSDLNYEVSNVVFGSGGGLLQKVNRDIYKWAQKATAVLVGNEWKPIFKDPVTDPGKKSFAGRKTLLVDPAGDFLTGNVDGARDASWTDLFVTYLDEAQPGKLLIDDSLAVIRERAFA